MNRDKRLRSSFWFANRDRAGFIHRSWLKNDGLPDDAFERPVIGICNTWSELVPCNVHLRRLAEHVKRGVWENGGLPLEFPVMSLGESLMRPTAMLFRNLVSMDVEESIRANPIDGVVLLGGCDKTTPALLMGAASVDVPAMFISSGPMLNGKFRGRDIGSGTDVWRMSEDVRAGTLSLAEFESAEAGMSRSNGTCMTMGTASTMACLVEALGVSLPDNGTLPAVDARRARLAQLTGRRIVDLVRQDVRLSKILTRQAFENAIALHSVIGGSTNAVIHLQALAGRLGVELSLDDWDRIGRTVPVLIDLQPSGRFLMEEFHYAGGVPAALTRIRDRLHLDSLTVTGRTLGENIESAEIYNEDVIRPLDRPVSDSGSIAVLRGNLCPDGAVIKTSAASAELLTHVGPAAVFESIEEYNARIDDPAVDISAQHVLVLKNCGPRGYPGMPEVGNLPLPRRLLERGITDMVRISDARMSGTAFGTVVLHVAPEAAEGGVFAHIRSGDLISLDVPARTLEVRISAEELERRRAEWEPPRVDPRERGYTALYRRHVLQADRGSDFDFLVGSSGSDAEGDWR